MALAEERHWETREGVKIQMKNQEETVCSTI